tara:strand:+ start:294385 stop:294942 length:558 start_codon:yes stop_codon:yes gene_type:complete
MRKVIFILFSQLLLSQFSYADPTIPRYSRKFFKHWNDENRDCRNKRAEILKERSLKAVTYRASSRGECTVKTGKWNDYYFPEIQTSASEVDIDHLIPLKNAWISGAYEWSDSERETFANDSENLVITYKKYNRQKGAQTPLTWAPVDRKYYCKYIRDWIRVKQKYQLKINPKILSYQKAAGCSQE